MKILPTDGRVSSCDRAYACMLVIKLGSCVHTQPAVEGWIPLQWRHNGHDGVSNHQPHQCLLNRLFGRKSKKTSKLRVTGHCVGNSPGTGEFPAQRASYAENVSIWWRHHVMGQGTCTLLSQEPSLSWMRRLAYFGRKKRDINCLWHIEANAKYGHHLPNCISN